MGKASRRIGVFVAVAAAVVLVAAASAFAGVHVSSSSLVSSSMSASLSSTGDAGGVIGNHNNGTSPVVPEPPESFEWFNQPVLVTTTHIADPDDTDDDIVNTGTFYTLSTNGADFGAVTPLGTDGGTVSAEGLYDVWATGADEDSAIATASIGTAFGIDMTKPVVTNDGHTLYTGGTGTITLVATDTMSGLQTLQYSRDGGPMDYSYDAAPNQSLSVPVTFSTAGVHTLSWHAIDNAGNIASGSFKFIVRSGARAITLSAKPGTGAEENSHFVTFSGSISPMPTTQTLRIVVQRKVSGVYVSYKTFSMTLSAFATHYSLIKKIAADGNFRAMTWEGAVHSAWKTFKVR